MLLEPGQRVGDGGVVGLLDLLWRPRVARPPTSADTDFTGVKVRSYPATASGR